MITVNCLSGGKTSSYISANYPAKYDVFALVRIEHEQSKFPDKKIRQEVEDRIQAPFIATAEDDMIIYTMLDLEQYIGRKITWVTGKTFDEVLETAGTLPDPLRRYCTTQMKLEPIFEWWRHNFTDPVAMRIGFRANEQRRAKNMIEKTNKNGILEIKAIVGKTKNGKRNKWANIPWQKPEFPLIKDGLFKDQIQAYWKDKPVRFAYMNNCVGCFHRNEILLKRMFEKNPNKMQWFANQEIGRNGKGTWKTGITYEKIKNHKMQIELFDDDFNDCDSGYCGI